MKFYFFILFFFILLVLTVSATDYYVDKNSIGGSCSDNNQGTITQPWCTIYKANNVLQAGDTVYIREGIYSNKIGPDYSGTQQQPISFIAYENEEVSITGTEERLTHALDLRDRDWIVVDKIKFDGIRGGEENGQLVPYEHIRQWVRLERSNHNIIRNCEFKYARGWFGVEIDKDSHYNKILNNNFKYCGFPEPPADDDSGNTITIRGNYNLIEGNDLSYGGHNLVEIRYGKYNIVRNNNLHSYWGRCIGLATEDNSDPEGNKFNVIERNKISFAQRYSNGVTPNPGMQNRQTYAIIRFNEFFENYGHGLYIYTNPGETEYGSFTKLYNNVFYHNGYDENSLSNAEEGLALYDWSQTQGEKPFRGINIKNNIIHQNSNSGIKFSNYCDPAKQVIENNLEDSNPSFIDESNYDFHLQSNSPAIDAGAWLTRTTNSGSNSRTIRVQDANYFIDGFGIVEGDLIQLEGQTITARITNVNYDTNTLTVDRSLTWSSGQGVNLPYSGDAPDIGAYEYESSPPSSVPGDLNNDGTVNILDLVIVASNFGLTNYDARADTNDDNTVNIFDLVYVATRII